VFEEQEARNIKKQPKAGRQGMSRFDRSLRPYRSSSSSPQRARATARMGEYQLQQWDAPYLLLDLPLEIQNHIFHFMTAKELYMSVSLVCQEWRELAMQELQWKRLCKRDFEFLVSIFEVKKPRSISWRLWWKFLGGCTTFKSVGQALT